MGKGAGTAALFAKYMRSQTHGEGAELKHSQDGFDWAALGNGHVFDVSLALHYYLLSTSLFHATLISCPFFPIPDFIFSFLSL